MEAWELLWGLLVGEGSFVNFAGDLLSFLGAFSGLKCNPGSLCVQLKWDLVLLMGPRLLVRESEGTGTGKAF